MPIIKKSGFTLVELLVTISIFVIISSVILSNYSLYARQTDLNRTAQEITLAFRKAQSFSLAVRGFGTGATLNFSAWGLHFENPSAPTLLTNPAKQFVFYSDILPSGAPNKLYDGDNDATKCSATPKECSELLQINTSAKIVKLCYGLKTDPTPNCSSPLNSVDITYQRPNPSITLSANGSVSAKSDIDICLTSSDGVYPRTIYIWSTGQVAVDNTPCP